MVGRAVGGGENSGGWGEQQVGVYPYINIAWHSLPLKVMGLLLFISTFTSTVIENLKSYIILR